MALITTKRLPVAYNQRKVPADPKQLQGYLTQQQQQLQTAFNAVNSAIVNGVMVGAATARPVPGQAGRLYYANDTQVLYIDNGLGGWDTI